MQKVFLVTLTVSYLALAVTAQSCGIEGTNETTLYIDPVTESTGGDLLLARFQTFGVASTSAVSSPHYKYIKAQRYSNGVYEFLTESIFPSFVRTERSPFVERSVNFRCEDGSSRRFTFITPVIDENDNPPTFNDVSSMNVTLPLVGNTFVVLTGIVVTDSDLELSNANVYITSSNRRFAPVVTELFSGAYPETYSYRVDFLVQNDVPVGEHQTIVTADDGQFPVSKIVMVTVIGSEEPVTEGTLAPSTVTPSTTTTEEVPVPEFTLKP